MPKTRRSDARKVAKLARALAALEQARVVTYHRADDTRENIYSMARGVPAQVNVLPIDLGALVGAGPRFMYLWAPGLDN